jgi:hypothetical protein
MGTFIACYLMTKWAQLRDRCRRLPDGGYSTEAIAVIATLSVLALTVVGIIAAKVIAKANSVDLTTP